MLQKMKDNPEHEKEAILALLEYITKKLIQLKEKKWSLNKPFDIPEKEATRWQQIAIHIPTKKFPKVSLLKETTLRTTTPAFLLDLYRELKKANAYIILDD